MRLHLHLARVTVHPRLARRSVRLRLTALYGALFLASGAGLLVLTNVLARGWPWPGRVDAGFIVASPPSGHTRALSGPMRGSVHDQLQAAAAQVVRHQLGQLLAGSAVALGVMAVVSVALGWVVAGRVLRPLREMTAAARAISEENLGERLAVPGPGDELKDLGDTIDGLLERLQAAFTAQRNFVASASHELRTPLTLTRTLLQMALTDPAPTLATYQATCRDVLEAGEHQEQLIEALLTLARSQRGLDHREPVDLADVTSSILHACKPDAARRGLAVTASITAAPVLGDARLLQRLAANLIDNALRHNILGGQISIQVAASNGHPRLTITNTGPVIPADHATRLLQPFQRLPFGRAASDDGLGLGLSIVAAIAQAHHAVLTVSPRPRGGLHIDIRFPPAATAAPTEKALSST